MTTTNAAQPARQDAEPMKTSAIILLFIGLMLAMFMFSLNQTVLSTALPTIVGELDGVDQMLWVSTAFMLASTIMMPIYGKIGDLFGRKPLFMFAIVAFLIGSTVALFAQHMDLLILGRVIQGIGGGGMMILAQSIIASVVPARERGKYMGIMGSVFAVSSVAGPLIGGWLTEGPGWRWAFTINYPLGILAIISAVFFLKVPKNTGANRKRDIDYAGMALMSIITTCIILVSAWGGHNYEWNSVQIIGLIVLGVVAIAAFIVMENRAKEPVIPLSLFQNRDFLICTLAGICVGVAMFGVLSYMPTYLQMVHGVEATLAGLMMTPMMVTMLITSTGVGFIVSKTGRYKHFPLIGTLIIAGSLALMSTLHSDSPVGFVMLYLALLGLGLGVTMQLLVLVVQNAFPVTMVGTATASNNYFRQVGGTLGMSFIGSLFTQRLLDNVSSGMKDIVAQAPDASVPQMSATSLTPAVVADLPEPFHTLIINSYNDALVPLFLWVAPLAILGFVILLFLPHTPLAKSLKTEAAQRETVTVGESDTLAEPAPIQEDFNDRHDDTHGAGTRRTEPAD